MTDAAQELPQTDRRRQNLAEIGNTVTKHFDHALGKTVVKIVAGEEYITKNPDEVISTVLGSCVAACIRDTKMGVGGMNHFMLPSSSDEGKASANMRFGTFAMEKLINDLLKAGAVRNRLEIKVFGGANVTEGASNIGAKNAVFIRNFLLREGYGVDAEDLGDTRPRRIIYSPSTGEVVRYWLRRADDVEVFDQEEKYRKLLNETESSGSVELFD